MELRQKDEAKAKAHGSEMATTLKLITPDACSIIQNFLMNQNLQMHESH